MEKNFEFGGRKFQLSKIDALKQFHIVRRVGPILSDLLPAMKDIGKLQKSDISEGEKLDNIAKFVTPIMEGLSKLSDADSELVLHNLLQSVEMQQVSGNWIRVSNGTLFVVQDLELPALLNLAGRAFMFNLAGFFAGLPQK